MPDPIWSQDFNVLFKPERLMEFFPTKEQTNEERVNAIVRLSLYVSIGLVVYHSNAKFFAIFLFWKVCPRYDFSWWAFIKKTHWISMV